MNNDRYELVKMKVRAVGKEHKHKQKCLPVGSQI